MIIDGIFYFIHCSVIKTNKYYVSAASADEWVVDGEVNDAPDIEGNIRARENNHPAVFAAEYRAAHSPEPFIYDAPASPDPIPLDEHDITTDSGYSSGSSGTVPVDDESPASPDPYPAQNDSPASPEFLPDGNDNFPDRDVVVNDDSQQIQMFLITDDPDNHQGFVPPAVSEAYHSGIPILFNGSISHICLPRLLLHGIPMEDLRMSVYNDSNGIIRCITDPIDADSDLIIIREDESRNGEAEE